MEIVLDNVTKTLHGSAIINGVSLRLASGHVYGLQGYNGSGKTMLMRLIAGLLLPTSGTVQIDGRTLGKDLDFPPSIGVLLENPAFLPAYTGVENLQLIASLRGVADDAQIKAAVARVGLDPKDKRKYKKYSLGMKQRLGIACAVFEKPDIIILDEPTNALDTDGVELVSEIISQERARGALIVLASHEKEYLHGLSDEIYTVENGRITGNAKGGAA